MLLNTALKVETVAALVLAWILVFVMPIRWVTGMFAPPAPAGDGAGDGMPPGPPAGGGAWAAAVARRVNRLAGAMPFSTHLLVKAVPRALLLGRRGMCEFTIPFASPGPVERWTPMPG
ncbi:hypothetical protein [Azospirillum sp. B506]|uniref:hypothetical protein n=1 Tax=Azospirillum sp. B506 TaxID=137721 RepID=UPI00034DBCAB|nr:hypothetical protein [Azospirillum sp. B506]